MTAVPDPQEALREQIAQAIAAHDMGWCPTGSACDCGWIGCDDDLHLADAVLPVVQAHERALEDARLMDLHSSCDERWREERDAARSDLAALRDAVSELADMFDYHAERFHGLARSLHDEFIEGKAVTYGTAARRLRSLLGDKENN